MPHADMPAKIETSVHIRKAENGYVANVCGGDEDKTYIYDNLDELMKDLKGIFSVAEESQSNNSSKPNQYG